jgi:serine/threonine protein kinase
MESLRRKRKGLEILPSSGKSLPPLTVILSHFSLGDYSRQRKKYKEGEDKEVVGSGRSVVKGVFTVPPCRSVSADPSCRGLKRKIGCIDAATQLGRKKKIEEEYDLGAYIGQGKFGSVVLCRSKVTGEVFACKMLRKGEELVHREVEIMQHLSGHPGVVTLKAVYEDLESFYLVMELCPEGRLLDKMAKERQYPEHRAANILKEIVSVIKYCHDMGVVHRDVKPENILLATSGKMKLADFGLAVRMSNGNNDFVNISVVFRYIQAHSHIPGYTSVCILYLSDLFFYFSNSFYFYCLLYAQRFSNIFRILHFFNTGVISAVMFLCRLDYVLCALISKLVFLSCRSEPQRCSWKSCLCCSRSFSR